MNDKLIIRELIPVRIDLSYSLDHLKTNIDYSSFFLNIKESIVNLWKLHGSYNTSALLDKYDSFEIKIRIEYDYDSYETILDIFGLREETKEEYNKRMLKKENARKAGVKAARQAKINKIVKEKELFEKLKKKYS